MERLIWWVACHPRLTAIIIASMIRLRLAPGDLAIVIAALAQQHGG